MTKEKKKKETVVLLQIENVRIIESDSRNVEVERYEESRNPITKEVNHRWRFKGFSGTILSALKLIVKKELLINKNALNDLKSHLKQVEDSNAKILNAIEKEMKL